MAWNDTLKRLRDVFVDLYGGGNIVQTVCADALLDTRRINFSDAPINVWQQVFREALNQVKVDALIKVAQDSFGDNSDLQQAVSAYNDAKTPTASVPTPAPTHPTPDAAALRTFMVKHFDKTDLDLLCADVGEVVGPKYGSTEVITAETVSGTNTTLPKFALDLVLFMQRRGWYADLVDVVRKARPGLI